ncbi:MAG: MarC family protein [Chloroflexi bacterium]|nr:MarC family protein [Chloroflexota bacterium]
MNPLPLQFGLLCFVSLFTMIDPLGALPVFVSMTGKLSHPESRRVALRAALTAWIALVLFALTGRFIFEFFGISVHSLRIVGGIIFFIMGYEMLEARLTRTKADEQSVSEYIEDIAITPLGIPLIAGPGAIATVIVLMNETTGEFEKQIALFGAITAVLVLSFLFLIGARQVMHALGSAGNKVLLRIMGLIVMAIAVEFFFNGLRPIIQSMKP